METQKLLPEVCGPCYDGAAPHGALHMRPLTYCAVVAAGLISLLPAFGAAPPAKPLDQVFTVDKAAPEVPVKDMLDFLQDRFNLTIRIDEKAFERAGREWERDKDIRLPKMAGAPLAFALEVVVQQVGGTVQSEGQVVTIVPGQRDLRSLLPPVSDGLKKTLAEKITLDKDITKGKFIDVVELFRDKYGVSIVVADWQFPIAGKPVGGPKRLGGAAEARLDDLPCSLKAGTAPLQTWLETVAKQVGGIVVPRGNLILIVPPPKAAS